MITFLFFLILVLFTVATTTTNNEEVCKLIAAPQSTTTKNSDINVVFNTSILFPSVLYVFLDETTTSLAFKEVASSTILRIHQQNVTIIAIGPTISVNAAAHIISSNLKSLNVLGVVAIGAQSTERAAAAAMTSLAINRAGSSVVDCKTAKLATLFSTDTPSISRLNTWVVPLSVRSHWTERSSEYIIHVKASIGFDGILDINEPSFNISETFTEYTKIIQLPADCPELEQYFPNTDSTRHPFDIVSELLTDISNHLVESGYTWGTASAVQWLTCVKQSSSNSHSSSSTTTATPVQMSKIEQEEGEEKKKQDQSSPKNSTFIKCINLAAYGLYIAIKYIYFFSKTLIIYTFNKLMTTNILHSSITIAIIALIVSLITFVIVVLQKLNNYNDLHYPNPRHDTTTAAATLLSRETGNNIENYELRRRFTSNINDDIISNGDDDD